MRFLTAAVLLIIASFVSVAAAGNIDNRLKTKYFDFDDADLVDFTIQQAPLDTSGLLTNPQIGNPLNAAQPQFSTLPNTINLQGQPILNQALLNQMQLQGQQALQSLTPQQYQQLLQQQQTMLANPLAGAQTVMSQLFPQQQQQQQAVLNAAAMGYNPYAAAYANQLAANPLAANNPSGVAGLVQQAAHQIVQAMNPGIGGVGGPAIGGVGNPFGPGIGGVGGIGAGGLGGLGGPAPFGPRP